jgi:hypothetical protein
MFGQMLDLITGLQFAWRPETWILFGGYSWKHERFVVNSFLTTDKPPLATSRSRHPVGLHDRVTIRPQSCASHRVFTRCLRSADLRMGKRCRGVQRNEKIDRSCTKSQAAFRSILIENFGVSARPASGVGVAREPSPRDELDTTKVRSEPCLDLELPTATPYRCHDQREGKIAFKFREQMLDYVREREFIAATIGA